MSSSTTVVNTVIPSAPVSDGSRFALAAPEKIRLPGEVLPVLRVLDSFVFLSKGSPVSLASGWLQNNNWAEIEVVGAVTTMTGSAAPLAQCGWITRLKWRWIRITDIIQVEIRQDSRFRKGELCFWLTTSLGGYAILSPHRGYSAAWKQAVLQPEIPTPVPVFRRVSERGPMPTWWDPAWKESWPPSVPEPPSGHKRAAPAASDMISAGPANDAHALDEERRVRRRDGGDAIVEKPSSERPECRLTESTNSALRHEKTKVQNSNDSAKPELGVKMSRPWNIVLDRVVQTPAELNRKSLQTGKKASS